MIIFQVCFPFEMTVLSISEIVKVSILGGQYETPYAIYFLLSFSSEYFVGTVFLMGPAKIHRWYDS